MAQAVRCGRSGLRFYGWICRWKAAPVWAMALLLFWGELRAAGGEPAGGMSAQPAGSAELEVPAEKFPGGNPALMMQQYWLAEADKAFAQWQTDYEARKTPEQIAQYQSRLRERFLQAIGPLPQRTPLEPQITGVIQREGYRVEKVIFQSQPKFFVTALLFLPDAARHKPPHAGVLIPCGHAKPAKGHDEYQAMGALLALNGMAALVFDPIDQGERGQYLGPDGWPKLWGTRGHSNLGIGSILLGRNTAWFEIYDGMRAIDYLQSRPEVDGQRIGCTGNSGGGTQTSYLMALDDRIRAAAPSCYLCGFSALLRTIGPQDAEQNIFGQLAFGMDHADYVMMRAPTPVLICAATKDFFDIRGTWELFRYAKRFYTRLGFAERVDLMENDAGHNYNTSQREAVARFMSRWLLGKDQPITEPKLQLLSAAEYQCTPEGQVMLLPGARSAYDLNEDYENQLAQQRAAAWKDGARPELLEKVRHLAGIRPLENLPKPKVEQLRTIAREGYSIDVMLLQFDDAVSLPALKFTPKQAQPRRAVVWLHDAGKAKEAHSGGALEQLTLQGNIVLAVDLPGTGQLRLAAQWKDAYMAYLLGRSYVGLRAEQILAAARLLKEQMPGLPDEAVELIAVGRVAVPALHAAALEPRLFAAVKLEGMLPSWASVIHGVKLAEAAEGAGVRVSRVTDVQPAEIVHAALTTYDLPELVASLGKKVAIAAPQHQQPK